MSEKQKMSDQPPSYEESNQQQQPQIPGGHGQPGNVDPNAPGNSNSYSQPQFHDGYSQYPAGPGSGPNETIPGYQGYSDYPDEKKTYPPPGSEYPPPPTPPPGGQYPPQGYPPQNPNYNPMNDPNVYKVKPQLVNITQANPDHLNPAYPEFQQREQQRWAQGDYPKHPKHGAPLSKGNTNPNKFGASAFPGRGGATYNNAARK